MVGGSVRARVFLAPSRLASRDTIRPVGSDVAVVLIVILVLVLLWRGPKTLPRLGEALGRGVREARKEVSKADAPETPSEPKRP
jgi:hypothetical protein